MFDVINLISNLNSCDAQVTLNADDTILYSSGQDLMSAVCKTQLALDCLSELCKINRLTVNIKKTKSMSVVNRSDLTEDKPASTIRLNGIQLDEVDKYNYLGVIVNNK